MLAFPDGSARSLTFYCRWVAQPGAFAGELVEDLRLGNSSDSAGTTGLINRLAAGSPTALNELLELHRPYLHQVVRARMPDELAARVDPSDVVQETQMVIARRITDFVQNRPTAFRIWIRREAIEKIIDVRRRHVDAKKRSVLREHPVSDVSCLAIANNLLSNSPSKALARAETREKVQDLLTQLGDLDQEMLSMRHVEGLSNAEVSDVLQITTNTARQRYGRALRRLHVLLNKRDIALDF